MIQTLEQGSWCEIKVNVGQWSHDFMEETKEANPEKNNYNIYISGHSLFLALFVLDVCFILFLSKEKKILNSEISVMLIPMECSVFP